ATPGPPLELELKLGVTKVKDSDGAVFGSLRLTAGRYSLSGSDSAYFESGAEPLELHVWDARGGVRFQPAPATSVWLTAGAGGAHAKHLALSGVVAPLEMRHQFHRMFAIEAGARGFLFQDHVSAWEARAGLSVSLFQIGYRVLDFNTGPPLQGPEIAFAFR